MPDQTDDMADEGKFVTAPLQEQPTNHPLTHFVIAAHLGIEEYTRDNEEECLRRAKAFFEMYERFGVPLVFLRDGTPFASRYVNRAFIRRHEGQRVHLGSKTAEEFDKHLKLVEASRTGVPSRSHHRIIRSSVSPHQPWAIYQEIDDHADTEIRRVELYLDGRMLWHNDEDGLEPGTTTQEYTETGDVPLLSVLNGRNGQCAEAVPAEQFEKLFAAARREGCKWIVDLHAGREWLTLDKTESVFCAEVHTTDDGSAFCTEHREIAGRVFPALFIGA